MYFLATGAGLIAFGLYAVTLAPALTWSNSAADGGDLLTAAFTWGIPHPTGYPTYLLALRGFAALFPFGDEAFLGNLFSATTAAVAVGVLFIVTVRLLRTLSIAASMPERYVYLAAGVSSVSVAASRELWSQATVTEVYALNALFVSLVLLAAIGLRDRTEEGRVGRRYGLGYGLLAGVALGNHLTIAAVIAPMTLWALLEQRGIRSLRPGTVWPIAAGGIMGLAVYGYAPVASAQLPALNWGHPDTAQGFWWMVSGTVYQGYAFGVTGGELVDRVVTSADLLLSQFAFAGVLLGLVGLPTIWAGKRGLALAHIVTMTLIVGYAVTYRTFDSFIYLIPVFMIFSIWMAAGVLRLIAGIDELRRRSPGFRRIRTEIAITALAVLILAVVPGFSLATNFGSLDLSDDRAASVYAEQAIETAGEGSIIFARTEETVFSLWYQSYVAEPERGVMAVSVRHIQFDWYWDDLKAQFPERMPETRPVGPQDRLLSIVDHNLGIRPLYEADPLMAYYPEFRLIEDGVLSRIES